MFKVTVTAKASKYNKGSLSRVFGFSDEPSTDELKFLRARVQGEYDQIYRVPSGNIAVDLAVREYDEERGILA